MSGFLASIAGATYAPAVVNTAVSFDGTNDFYSVSGLTTTATDSKYLTIAFTWFHASGANSRNQNFITVRLGTTSGENGWEVCLQSGRFRYSAPNNSGSDTDMVYGDYLGTTENAYNQMVAYIDHTSFANCKWYVNGVDRTSSLLNGAAIGAVNLTNVNLNWGSSNVSIKIGEQDTAFAGTTGFDDFLGRISQIYVHNASDAPTISKFWNSTSGLPIDLGTNGTATGLAQPLIYHYGNTSTFPTNNGTGFNSYTLTATGNVASAAGPTYGTFVRTAKSVTANNSAAVSTAQSKFGTGSVVLANSSSSHLTSSASSDFNLSATDFTVEGWFWPTGANNGALASNYEFGTNNGFEIYAWSSGSFLLGSAFGGASIAYVQSSTGAYSNSTWSHWAVTRTGSTMQMYCNGNRVYTTASFGIDSWATPNNAIITIGRAHGQSGGTFSDPSTNAYGFDGYQDEIRVSNTVRYTGTTYTVPTAAFTNDANTLLLVHCDGTNGSTSFTDSTT